MIELEKVAFSYGDNPVLADLSLTIERGEFVGLVGPNGAGKTTALQLVNGIQQPDSGTIRLDGDRLGSLSTRETSRRVATVPQDTTLGFEFCVEDVIAMGRTPHESRLSWAPDRAPVEAAMERTETLQFRDRPVGDLSGGQRQRVLLARALAQDTPALLLDEPTASLDINHQVRILERCRDLLADDRALLAAIHDLELAARFCDRLLLLADGCIRSAGPPEAVLADDALTTAFGTETAVTENPVTGTPELAAVGERPDRALTVHLDGGGGAVATALGALWRAGFGLSLGPVPAGDIAARVAAHLEIDTVATTPFSSPKPDQTAKASERARAADVLVLGPESGRSEPAATLSADRPPGTPVVHLGPGTGESGDGDIDTPRDVAGETDANEDGTSNGPLATNRPAVAGDGGAGGSAVADPVAPAAIVDAVAAAIETPADSSDATGHPLESGEEPE